MTANQAATLARRVLKSQHKPSKGNFRTSVSKIVKTKKSWIVWFDTTVGRFVFSVRSNGSILNLS